MAAPPPNFDDYSPSATLIPFDTPLPLLRNPIKSTSPNNPTLPPYVLAFTNPQSFSAAYSSCKSQITQQCYAGARIGCSIAASNKCNTPWWTTLLGISNQDFNERAKCEEQEMEACLVAARGKCREFAMEKCCPTFRDARVVIDGFVPEVVEWKEVGKLVGLVYSDKKMLTSAVKLWEAEKILVRLKSQLGMRICRGKDLMDLNYIPLPKKD